MATAAKSPARGGVPELITVDEAAALLKTGRPVIFPTDTVCGLGLCPAFAASPAELFALKGRDEGKPVAWLVSGADALDEWGSAVPDWARRLARSHWPGALTLVVRAAPRVPAPFASAAGTIGLRMPASPTALALMEALGAPLATTSANLSGASAVVGVNEVDRTLAARVPVVAPLAGERPAPGAAASTVVDCTGAAPVVLRQGPVQL
ncbi:L-threonylcarbamoyladenylate synthase [Parvibacter caecicola]|uniref:L-threonylcarbamoyladenylate synthase n=1 Tax=Parvibacter caecicola TaxID=747645 RepID=A0A4T9T9S2_9ACTN|nr:L-threonylcarbamoyladenylate synthase [Parvibacter caecicola]TJW09823.1 threonylcarbamoyl-AMP synthase [Parvibacter caecicola]